MAPAPVMVGDRVNMSYRIPGAGGRRGHLFGAQVLAVSPAYVTVGHWRPGVATFAVPCPPDVWHEVRLEWRTVVKCEVL